VSLRGGFPASFTRSRERKTNEAGLPSAVAIVGAGLVVVAVFPPFGAIDDPQLEPSFDGLVFNQGKLMLGLALVGLVCAATRFWVSKPSLGLLSAALVVGGLLIGGITLNLATTLDRVVATKTLAMVGVPPGFEAMRGLFVARAERYVEIKPGYYVCVAGAVVVSTAGLWASLNSLRGWSALPQPTWRHEQDEL